MTEETIIGGIAVMAKAAGEIPQAVFNKEYNTAMEKLKVVNLQGKKLESKGEEVGLKDLPKLEEVENIKKAITEARAAVPKAFKAVARLEKFSHKKGKNQAEAAAIREEESKYQKIAEENLRIMKSRTITALEEAKKEPWIDPVVLSKPKNIDILIDLVKRQGYYEQYSLNEIIAKSKRLILKRIDLSGRNLTRAILNNADLSGANFSRATLTMANLSKANLSGANFTKAKLHQTDLSHAILIKANFTQANLSGAVLIRADLSEAILIKANLYGAFLTEARLVDADLTEADFEMARISGANFKRAKLKGAKNLTENQLGSVGMSG